MGMQHLVSSSCLYAFNPLILAGAGASSLKILVFSLVVFVPATALQPPVVPGIATMQSSYQVPIPKPNKAPLADM
jgi:hypothetical protein